ncbi:MAG TPA: GDP-mannose 4,6-dehydratase [Candidatus Baltobacteraceae bacterium]|jgi:GDP-4-dehydro-6-deoxy-D-mannose reductase|nr:GDP-mannose 4,6-dehydratase [Candidatus Baltobacteraceae bacterium]
MRALVTGASGFVGKYLVDELRAAGYDVLACGGPNDVEFLPVDLADTSSLRAALDIGMPDVVFHLAAQTFVPDSVASPRETYLANTLGTANLLEAMRSYARNGARAPRLLFVSSAEVYGAQPPEAFPLDERTVPSPANPYAASKAAAEAIVLGETRSLGIDAVIARAFNHIGPGQSERFVVASFAHQLASIAAGGDPVLLVGNLDARRDFLDVRDVVRAYVALARDGAAGEIYNVCSGSARSIRDVLRELIIAAHVPVEVRDDPARMRPSDTPLFVGNNAKLGAATGWAASIGFERSIRDIYRAAQTGLSRPQP